MMSSGKMMRVFQQTFNEQEEEEQASKQARIDECVYYKSERRWKVGTVYQKGTILKTPQPKQEE